jgi:hypothetical protein
VASRIRGQVDEFFVRLQAISPALRATSSPSSEARVRRGHA